MEKRPQCNSFKKDNNISKMAQIFEPNENQNMFKSIVPKAETNKNKININMDDGDELESDEEQDNQDIITPIKDVENYSLKDIILPKYSSEDLTQEQLKKIYDLKVLTENIISKTVKNRNNANIVKALVSKKRTDFVMMDLTLILRI